MIKTSGLHSISICDQTNMSLGASVTLDDIFSDFSIGFNGHEDLSVNYSLSKFNYFDKFIGCSNGTNSFSVNLSQDHNGRLISINNKPTEYISGNFGKISGFYFSGNAYVDYSVLGVQPAIELDDVDAVISSSSPAEFTLQNNSSGVNCSIYGIDILNSNIANLNVYGFTSGQSLLGGVPVFFNTASGTLVQNGYVDMQVRGDFGSKLFSKNILVNTLENPILMNVSPSNSSFEINEGEFIDFLIEGFAALPNEVQSILTVPSGDIFAGWNLYSGLNESSLFNYKESGKFFENKYEDAPISMPYEASVFHRVRVEYLGGSTDNASLVVSIGNQIKNITITPNV